MMPYIKKRYIPLLIEALEHRISDLETWLDEGESQYPGETYALEQRRQDIKSHQLILEELRSDETGLLSLCRLMI
jgi:hypothetical protein